MLSQFLAGLVMSEAPKEAPQKPADKPESSSIVLPHEMTRTAFVEDKRVGLEDAVFDG